MKLYRVLMSRMPMRGRPPSREPDSKIGKYTKDYANLPERYLARKSTRLFYRSPAHRAFFPTLDTARIENHTMERPWTQEYWQENTPFKNQKKIYVEPIREEDWMWFRGDRVEILKGPDKGKQGYINYIVQERNWVCVEGLNCKYVNKGQDDDFPGMMIKEEQPLLVTTDIKLVDPSDEKATEVEWQYDEGGERVRVCLRSGIILPMPTQAEETVDYKTKKGYVDNEVKDTPAADVAEITYEPKLCTFEMEIMESMGIKEERKPQKTYWY